MTSPRKPGFVLPVAVTLSVLLGLYVGAYCWMVVPLPVGYGLADDTMTPVYQTGWDALDDKLVDAPVWTTQVFTPIHWLDRRIRPHVWEPTE
jgi:hypothetical protein